MIDTVLMNGRIEARTKVSIENEWTHRRTEKGICRGRIPPRRTDISKYINSIIFKLEGSTSKRLIKQEILHENQRGWRGAQIRPNPTPAVVYDYNFQ